MKSIKYIIGLFLLTVAVTACQDDEFAVGDLITPSNMQIDVDIVGADASNPNGDGSGAVNFTVTADNALSYHIVFNGETRLAKNGKATFNFSQTGLETYTLTAIAYGKGGLSSSKNVAIDVLVLYEPPADLLDRLVGDGTRTFRIKDEVNGHFGLGPPSGLIPGEWFSAGAFDKSEVGMYDDRYIFNQDGTFTHITNNTNDEAGEDPSGTVFGRIGLIDELGSSGGNVNGADVENLPFNDYTGEWTLSAPGGVETLSLSGLGFIGYYTGGNHQYELFEWGSQNDTEFLLRTTDGNNEFDWWFIITSIEPGDTNPDPFTTQFNNLSWSDEFDTDGPLDTANWSYDLGTGDNGWGNGELQSYTNDPSNVKVEGGSLKITAKSAGNGEEYYYDEFEIVDASGNTQSAIQDFEGSAPAFTGFGGAESQVIDNPDASGNNTTSKVGELSKGVGSEVWAGTFFETGSALDLSTNNRISVKTWSPKVGAVVKLKLENQDASITHEVDLSTTVANTWEELVFDFSGAPTADYVRVVIFFDFGNSVSGYTSARVKTQGALEFTYGRVEIRAKLPTGGGTWPALWMLGADFETNAWPAAGEIDIMEHVGNNQNRITGATHDPNNFGGNARVVETTAYTDVSDAFHDYAVEWRTDKIIFLIDGEVYGTLSNDASLPFNKDFFLILNVAMGGNLGGDIDPAFTESTMEVDYVRVYQ